MKTKYIITLIICVIILVALISYIALRPNVNNKISAGADLKTQCCVQCLEGASKDVRGMDISNEKCILYKEQYLSSDCISYFEDNSLTVSNCRE